MYLINYNLNLIRRFVDTYCAYMPLQKEKNAFISYRLNLKFLYHKYKINYLYLIKFFKYTHSGINIIYTRMSVLEGFFCTL